MKRYRLQAQGLNKTIQKWRSPKKKRDDTMSEGGWQNWRYYGKWAEAIRSILNDEIVPIDAELKEQLENFDRSLDEAVQQVIDSLELGETDGKR